MSLGINLRIKEIIKEKKLPQLKLLNINLTIWNDLIKQDDFINLNCEFKNSNYDRTKEDFLNHLQNLDEEKFDIIFLQYPLGLRKGDTKEAILTRNIIDNHLNDDGYLLDISTQSTFSAKHLWVGAEIYRRYRENIIGEIYKPETSVSLSLYEYRKKSYLKKKKFESEILCCDLRNINENHKNLDDIELIKVHEGLFVSALVSIRQNHQIKSFESKNLTPINFSIAHSEIVSVDLLKSNKKNRNKVLNKISKYQNGVFIPVIPSKSTKCEIDISKLKDSRYWLVTFDQSIFLNDYVMSFLNSDFGREQLLSLSIGNYIPHLSSISLNKLILPMKNTEQQEKIVKNKKKIDDAHKIFNEYIRKVSENLEDENFEFKPEEIMEQIPGYSLTKILKEEETKSFERKSTLRFDTKQNKIQDYITDQVLKTIVAFLNTEGGNLVIGQSDDKKVIGIEVDKFKNQDDCSKYLKDKIKAKIGLKFLETYIKYKFLKHENKTLLVITCAKLPHSERAFINETDFYIRSGPSNEKLNTKATIEYIEMKSKI